MEMTTDDVDTNESCHQITSEICLLWMEKFDSMNKVLDSLVEERSNALSRCEMLEKENAFLKEQIVQCEKVDKIMKENEELRKEVHNLKQKQESVNSSCRAMFQSFETVHKKMLAIPIKAEARTGPEVVHSLSHDAREIPISNESCKSDEISTIVSCGENEPSDFDCSIGDEYIFSNTLAQEPKTVRVEVKVPSSTPTSDASQKCTKEKHGMSDKRNSALGGIPEDMKLLDGYCSVASKRKLANEIAYSESKKVKGHENKVIVEKWPSLVDDVCDKMSTPQSYSTSIFTKRQLECKANDSLRGVNTNALSPDYNTFKENSINDSSKERSTDGQRDDPLSSTFFRQSHKDQRMHKQYNDLESGSSESGRRSNPANERNVRHKTRERADRDRRN